MKNKSNSAVKGLLLGLSLIISSSILSQTYAKWDIVSKRVQNFSDSIWVEKTGEFGSILMDYDRLEVTFLDSDNTWYNIESITKQPNFYVYSCYNDLGTEGCIIFSYPDPVFDSKRIFLILYATYAEELKLERIYERR